ncbi:MAG: hypothetical protein LBD82_04180, partial [Deltaproteobacteria bacterium]|nr:hypothetical protein [Deltaproteobacteria bacterium]
MRKLAFVLLAVFLLWPPPALAGAVRGTIPPPPANASGLWNFAGFWRLNLEKSRPLVAPETVVWLEEMKGFR